MTAAQWVGLVAGAFLGTILADIVVAFFTT